VAIWTGAAEKADRAGTVEVCLGRGAVVESREVDLANTGARMVACVDEVTVRWVVGRMGRVKVGE
jgi:hypothetical protein